jgi:hypothetical protein
MQGNMFQSSSPLLISSHEQGCHKNLGQDVSLRAVLPVRRSVLFRKAQEIDIMKWNVSDYKFCDIVKLHN